MNKRASAKTPRLNRRAFLYGAGGVAIGLPFLESAPERSAWAQADQPSFALFIGTSNGVIADHFWPAQLGELIDLASDPSAAAVLADFASSLSYVGGLKLPGPNNGDSHSYSYAQMLTGAAPVSAGGGFAKPVSASLDVILGSSPGFSEPLTVYSGQKWGYINEAMSWAADGSVRTAESNPFVVYTDLVTKAGFGSDSANLANSLLVRRQSVIDLAREELLSFQARSRTSQADRVRLDQHVNALREIEQSLDGVATATCTTSHLNEQAIIDSNDTYEVNGMVEDIARLQLELVAFAFACNLHQVATLQSGDGQDPTRYAVPSNERGWTFHHISHQIQSDGAVGEDALAVQAHIEIDRLRMQTLEHGIRALANHQLLDKSVVMWANQMSDGRAGGFTNLPIILAGNPYGRLKTGRYVQYPGRTNGELLSTIAYVMGVDQLIGEAQGRLDDLLA